MYRVNLQLAKLHVAAATKFEMRMSVTTDYESNHSS